jgi:small-conductance mechanosensitive channel
MEKLLDSLRSFDAGAAEPINLIAGIALAITTFLLLKLLFRIVRGRLESLSKKTATVVDDIIAKTLGATRTSLLLLVSVWVGARLVGTGEYAVYMNRGLLIVLVVQFALWANRGVGAYIEYYSDAHRESDPSSVLAFQGMSFVVRLLVWSIAVMMVIDNLGYDVTALVAGLGIGGVAIALAVQNILGDLFASLSIVLDKPFVIGDFIIVDDLMGVVEKIGVKTTRLRSLSGEQLIFANSDLLNSRVRNYKRMFERRVVFGFGVLYQTTPDQLEAIPPLVKDIIEDLDETRFDRAHFKGFGDSSLDFEVVYYVLTPDYNAYMDSQQAINLALCRAFAERGVEFAYPTRTLFIERGDEQAAEAGKSE